MHTRHSAVWLDHNEARIFHVDASTFAKETIESPKAHVQLHRKSGQNNDGHRAPEAQAYYHDVAMALGGAEQVLVVGPATAKLEFLKHVHKHHHDLEPRIIGVETVDHPSDGQLVAYFHRYFAAADVRGGSAVPAPPHDYSRHQPPHA